MKVHETCQASKTAFRSRCPNIQPRAHARLTGLTNMKQVRKEMEKIGKAQIDNLTVQSN